MKVIGQETRTPLAPPPPHPFFGAVLVRPKYISCISQGRRVGAWRDEIQTKVKSTTTGNENEKQAIASRSVGCMAAYYGGTW